MTLCIAQKHRLTEKNLLEYSPVIYMENSCCSHINCNYIQKIV